MTKSIVNILFAAISITIIGFLMDSDPKEPSMLMRFTEFFGVVALISVAIALVYFPSKFALAAIRKQ